MTTLVWAVVCIALALAGVGLGYWLGNQRRATESAKLDAVQAELDDYRKRVSEHFSETATRFHDLGRQYRELYQHMASGSEKLCNVEDSGGKLPFAPTDRPAIAAVEPAEQDVPDSEEPVRREQDDPDSEEPVRTEQGGPDSKGPVRTEHDDTNSEEPVQTEQDDPGTKEPVRTEHDGTTSEPAARAAEEATDTATGDDSREPDEPAPEKSTEPEPPIRTYH